MNIVKRLACRAFRHTLSHFPRRLAVPRNSRGYSVGSAHILIQLTYKCNLRCVFCGQWGETGRYKALPAGEVTQMLPLSVLQRVIDELPLLCAVVSLFGGETLEYPDVVPLVRYIKQTGRRCGIVTNGTLLAEHAGALVEAGVDDVAVSVDGCEETHDRLRGVQGTFQAAMQGIRMLRTERLARGLHRPVITVAAILVPEAASEVPHLIQQARAAELIAFSFPNCITRASDRGKPTNWFFKNCSGSPRTVGRASCERRRRVRLKEREQPWRRSGLTPQVGASLNGGNLLGVRRISSGIMLIPLSPSRPTESAGFRGTRCASIRMVICPPVPIFRILLWAMSQKPPFPGFGTARVSANSAGSWPSTVAFPFARAAVGYMKADMAQQHS